MYTSSFDQLSQSPEIQVFSCSECQYAFTAQDVLQKHMRRIHNDIFCQILENGQISFVVCQRITSSATKQKQVQSEKTRSYSHRQLTKTVTQPEVKTHPLTYTGKKTHVCKLCDKSFCRLGTQSFKRLNILSRHQHLHAEKTLHFKQCGESFSQLSSPKKLQLIHSRKKPLRSTQGAKSVKDDDTRKKKKKKKKKSVSHVGNQTTQKHVHTRKRPFSCTQCGKSFSQLNNMKTHQRVHNGEKPFHCKECCKRFSQLGNLNAHQRLHNGEKPFVCKQCDRTFSQLGNLQTHQRLHTGEKPFLCKHCEKSFNQLGQLNAHQRVHTPQPCAPEGTEDAKTNMA